MAGPLHLVIDDVDYSHRFRRWGLTITEALRVEANVMQVVIVGTVSDPWPLEGNYVELTQDGDLLFAGRILASEVEQTGSPADMAITYQCTDFTADFDRHLIQEKYEAQLAGDIVRQIVGRVGYGFSSAFVEDGAVIQAVEPDLEYPSAIVSKIGDSIEFNWYIDYQRRLHFFYIRNRPGPVAQIDFDNDTQTYYNMTYGADVSQVKNVIYLRGAKAKSTNAYVQQFKGDGQTRFFPLAYEPWDIGTTTIKVDDVPRNLLFDTIDGQAGDANGGPNDVYVCFDNWGFRTPDAQAAPGVNADVEITYNYAYEPIVRVDDPASIQEMYERENHPKAPSNGVHEVLYNIPELRVESEQAITEYGYLLLFRYARIPRTIRFSSQVYGWRPGDYFRGISLIRGFDAVFYVHNITKKLFSTHGGTVWEYNIEASTVPFPG